MRKELYISVDIEADGPIPGTYSMTSLGASVAGYREQDGTYTRMNPDLTENQFYTELKPISNQYVLQALKVGIYDNFGSEQVDADLTGEKIREYLNTQGETPEEGMKRFVEWVKLVKERTGAKSVVFAAFPLGFDWLFTYWYLMNFAGESPFGFSSHIDIKTLYSARAKSSIQNSTKSRMNKQLLSKRVHNHRAVDDAIEQGELLMNILMWQV